MPRVGSSKIMTRGDMRQPFAQHDLLLVAAAEIQDQRLEAGRLDLQRGNLLTGDFALTPARIRPKRGRPGNDGSLIFSRTDISTTKPSVRRFSGQEKCRAAMASRGLLMDIFSPPRKTSRAGAASKPDNGLGHFGASGAHQPGETQDFPPRRIKGNCFPRMQ